MLSLLYQFGPALSLCPQWRVGGRGLVNVQDLNGHQGRYRVLEFLRADQPSRALPSLCLLVVTFPKLCHLSAEMLSQHLGKDPEKFQMSS